MVFTFIIWAFIAVAVHGAVLNSQDTLLIRVARSPPPPPPPIPPFGIGPLPRGEDRSRGSPLFSGSSASASSATQNGFQSGSIATAHAVSGGFNQHSGKEFSRNNQNQRERFSENHQSEGHIRQNGFNAGSLASAQAVARKGGYSGKQDFGAGIQQKGFNSRLDTSGSISGKATGGAFGSLNHGAGLQTADQGCSSCAKGGSAVVSNAKTHSGAATAVAVNNG